MNTLSTMITEVQRINPDLLAWGNYLIPLLGAIALICAALLITSVK